MKLRHHQTRKERAKRLIQLARALYDSAVFEEDKDRLELHRHVALGVKQLVDEKIDEAYGRHTDLGLELLLFIELKADGNPEAEADRKEVQRILEELEAEYDLSQRS